MKSVELKIVDVEIQGKPIRLSYKQQIAEIMKTPTGNRGADIDEVRRSIHILDALDACKGDTLQLEDADFEYMKQRIQEANWPVIDRWVLAFVEDVTTPRG
jgi:hypothetical protein